MHRPVTLTVPTRRVRRPGVTTLAVALAITGVALAGCSSQSPTQTNVPYIPADGVPASIGAVQARDLLVVAASKGAAGVLSGSIINTGTQPVAFTFLTVADAQGSATSGTTVQLAPRQQQRITGVQFPALTASPGALLSIVLKTSAGQQNVQVPVLLPDGIYATLTATAVPTTAGSTPTTPTAGATSATGATATSAATSGTATPVAPTSPTG